MTHAFLFYPTWNMLSIIPACVLVFLIWFNLLAWPQMKRILLKIWKACTQASTMRPHKSAHFILLNLIPLIAWENNLAQLCSLHLPLRCTKPWNHVWHPAIYHTDAEWWKGKKERSVTREEMELIQCHSTAPALQWHTDRAPLNALCRSSPLCTLTPHAFSVVIFGFMVAALQTPLVPVPEKGQLCNTFISNQHMQIPTTCTHRLLLRKNIYYITMSFLSLPKLECRLWSRRVFTTAEIICELPLQTPDLASALKTHSLPPVPACTRRRKTQHASCNQSHTSNPRNMHGEKMTDVCLCAFAARHILTPSLG